LNVIKRVRGTVRQMRRVGIGENSFKFRGRNAVAVKMDEGFPNGYRRDGCWGGDFGGANGKGETRFLSGEEIDGLNRGQGGPGLVRVFSMGGGA